MGKLERNESADIRTWPPIFYDVLLKFNGNYIGVPFRNDNFCNLRKYIKRPETDLGRSVLERTLYMLYYSPRQRNFSLFCPFSL